MQGRSRNTDPQTSKDAAEFDASYLMAEIYKVIERFGEDGCISSDVEIHLPMYSQRTITPRFAQMIDLGMIELTGETRLGDAGRSQLVRRVLPPPFIKKPRETSELVDLRARVKALEELNAELMHTLTSYWWDGSC